VQSPRTGRPTKGDVISGNPDFERVFGGPDEHDGVVPIFLERLWLLRSTYAKAESAGAWSGRTRILDLTGEKASQKAGEGGGHRPCRTAAMFGREAAIAGGDLGYTVEDRIERLKQDSWEAESKKKTRKRPGRIDLRARLR